MAKGKEDTRLSNTNPPNNRG